MKKCLYCNEFIDTDNDDYQKVGKKIDCIILQQKNLREIEELVESEKLTIVLVIMLRL